MVLRKALRTTPKKSTSCSTQDPIKNMGQAGGTPESPVERGTPQEARDRQAYRVPWKYPGQAGRPREEHSGQARLGQQRGEAEGQTSAL